MSCQRAIVVPGAFSRRTSTARDVVSRINAKAIVTRSLHGDCTTTARRLHGDCTTVHLRHGATGWKRLRDRILPTRLLDPVLV